MTEQEIFQTCVRLKTIKPLLQAVRFGSIKFKPIVRSVKFFFGMQSLGGFITFENDMYFYTQIGGKDIDSMVFANDEKGTKLRFEQELCRINDKLRGIQ